MNEDIRSENMKKKRKKRKLTKSELLQMLLEKENTDIKKIDEMIDLLVSKNVSFVVNGNNEEELTFGERMSDNFAKFAGSWTFIIIFTLILIIWIIVNSILKKPFDTYPFILLNLILSCVAALQAPIIMMSQNRQEKKDRVRSENDYKMDLKSALILENLYEKINTILEFEQYEKYKIKELDRQLKKENE